MLSPETQQPSYITERIRELEAENARLKAPVSDEEQELLNDYTEENMQNDLRRAVDRMIDGRLR